MRVKVVLSKTIKICYSVYIFELPINLDLNVNKSIISFDLKISVIVLHSYMDKGSKGLNTVLII